MGQEEMQRKELVSSARPSEDSLGFTIGGLTPLLCKSPSPCLVTDFSAQERPRAQGCKHIWQAEPCT